MKQLVLESRGQKVTTSLRIAEKFGVSHKVVMKAIRKALKAGSKDEFLAVRQNLTIPVVGEVKQNKIYLVTREGLLRLAPVLEKDAVLNEFLFAFDGGGTDTE